MRQFKVLFFAAAILLAGLSAAFAQTPRMFSYQGLALDASTGKPITNGPHSVTVNLYTVATGGTAIYTETFSGGSAPNFTGGLFDVIDSTGCIVGDRRRVESGALLCRGLPCAGCTVQYHSPSPSRPSCAGRRPFHGRKSAQPGYAPTA